MQNWSQHPEGITLRQAALITGLAYLTNPAPFCEMLIPKLVVAGNIVATVQNLGSHQAYFGGLIVGYFFMLVGDMILAWSLYFLMAPVNRAVSLLASLFQVAYAAVAFGGVIELAAVLRMVRNPEHLAAFGPAQFDAQVQLLVESFRWNWGMSLVLFGFHLILLGYLVYRSGYIPRFVGASLAIAGLGWVIDGLRPYLFPNASLGFLMIAFCGELVFVSWLLIRGWKLQEPALRVLGGSTFTPQAQVLPALPA